MISQENGRPASGTLSVMRLGCRPYEEVWALQAKLQRSLIDGEGRETLIICEHFPVITAGKSADSKNLLVSADALESAGIQYFEVERGGDMTYHGPGQLVAYPILDLRLRRQDISWYMRALEEVVIKTLHAFGIASERIPGKTGVWMPSEGKPDTPARKIASLGVKLSHWCTMHGMALNVNDCEIGFRHINPCGFSGIVITSMERESGRHFTMTEVADTFLAAFTEVFETEKSAEVLPPMLPDTQSRGRTAARRGPRSLPTSRE